MQNPSISLVLRFYLRLVRLVQYGLSVRQQLSPQGQLTTMYAILNGILDWTLNTLQDPKIGDEYKQALLNLESALRSIMKFY